MLHLFTYGTLQPGQRNAHLLTPFASSHQRATCAGWQLWHLQAPHNYPAIIQGQLEDIIHGTLFSFEESLTTDILRRCDHLEEFDPCDPEKSLYLRQLTKVSVLNSPHPVDAHIYIWNPVHTQVLRSQHIQVQDGNWASYISQHAE